MSLPIETDGIYAYINFDPKEPVVSPMSIKLFQEVHDMFVVRLGASGMPKRVPKLRAPNAHEILEILRVITLERGLFSNAYGSGVTLLAACSFIEDHIPGVQDG